MAAPSNPTASLAATAYSAAQKYADPSKLTSIQSIGDQPNGGFGDMLQSALNKVSASGTKADTQSIKAISGKADLVDVVTAVAESEAALETLVAVRDKVIAAYEEIMRMPV